MKMINEIPITVKAKGKLGGEIIGNVYVTRRRPIHVMRRTGGSFGISEDVLKKLKAFGVEYILFLYFGKKEQAQFVAKLEQYMKSDLIYYDDGDKQYHVRLRDMIKINGVATWRHTVKELQKKPL